MKYRRINLLDSINPLDCSLWPHKIAAYIKKAAEKGKYFYLQVGLMDVDQSSNGGWEGLWNGSTSMPCLIKLSGKQASVIFTKNQYPYVSVGGGGQIAMHKLVALVCVPCPDPKRLKEVDHINNINNWTNIMFARALHSKYANEIGVNDIRKINWHDSNLQWLSSRDNLSKAGEEEHKKYGEFAKETLGNFVARNGWTREYDDIVDSLDREPWIDCVKIKAAHDESTEYHDEGIFWNAVDEGEYDNVREDCKKIFFRKCTKSEYKTTLKKLCYFCDGKHMALEPIPLREAKRHEVWEKYKRQQHLRPREERRKELQSLTRNEHFKEWKKNNS